MHMKSVVNVGLRAIALILGIVFPSVTSIWKIIILVTFIAFRVMDIENDKKLMGVTSLFFIGMIASFTFKLFLP